MKPWLTKELKQEVRNVFEPRYKRILTEQEVIEMAQALASFMEVYVKGKYYGKVTK